MRFRLILYLVLPFVEICASQIFLGSLLSGLSFLKTDMQTTLTDWLIHSLIHLFTQQFPWSIILYIRESYDQIRYMELALKGAHS